MEGLPGDIRTPRGLTPEQLRLLQQRTSEIARDVYRPQRDLLSELLALDLDWQLAESLLQKADKMSMGGSIELRTPLLDLRIAELAARLPRQLKLPPGGPGKLVLRQCLARKLHEPLTRPKKGFPVPLRDWFAGPLREQVEGALFAANSACARAARSAPAAHRVGRFPARRMGGRAALLRALAVRSRGRGARVAEVYAFHDSARHHRHPRLQQRSLDQAGDRERARAEGRSARSSW